MSNITGAVKSDRKRTGNDRSGPVSVPAPARQDPIDRAAQILRIMILTIGGMNHPVHHDLRGILIDTHG